MRIPNANDNFEDVWYWENFGQLIYKYSFYYDRFQQKGDLEDKKKYEELKKKIPEKILDDYLWRRDRNFNFTLKIVNLQNEKKIFDQIFITLDDNAEFGLNINEANRIKKIISDLKIENYFNIYPGWFYFKKN
jgi:hypothetical protein